MSKEDKKKPEDPKDVALRDAGTEVADYDFGADAGAGLEDVRRDEFVIPFLRILQSNSPQVDENAPGYMAGAKPGMILNLGTGELIDGKSGADFIPVHRDHNYPEWTPRDSGGGFVGIRSDDDPLVLELRAKQGQFGKLITTSGTELVEAYYLYGMPLVEGVAGRAVVAFSSTQIKEYRRWIGRVTSMKYKLTSGEFVRPPLWAHRWHLATVPQQNKKGKFFGWQLTLSGKLPDGREDIPLKSFVKRSDPLYAEGRAFYDLIKAGQAKVDHTKAEPGEDREETGF